MHSHIHDLQAHAIVVNGKKNGSGDDIALRKKVDTIGKQVEEIYDATIDND
jgi:hypothetical protein